MANEPVIRHALFMTEAYARIGSLFAKYKCTKSDQTTYNYHYFITNLNSN